MDIIVQDRDNIRSRTRNNDQSKIVSPPPVTYHTNTAQNIPDETFIGIYRTNCDKPDNEYNMLVYEKNHFIRY